MIAAEAFGPENVIGVSLPSSISSQHSRDDARLLAANLGIRFETIGIADAVASCESALGPLFSGRPRDVAEENIQARVRGARLTRDRAQAADLARALRTDYPATSALPHSVALEVARLGSMLRARWRR